jgi:hypothetical protein
MPITNADRTIIFLIGTNLFSYFCGLTLIKALHKEQERNKNFAELTRYMASLLEKYDVPLTEFDVIALNEIVREHNG